MFYVAYLCFRGILDQVKASTSRKADRFIEFANFFVHVCLSISGACERKLLAFLKAFLLNTESVFRQCLEDGSWFSCPATSDQVAGNGSKANLNMVGWTNYSLCWTASTQKIMADLNQKATCPNEESDEDAEV